MWTTRACRPTTTARVPSSHRLTGSLRENADGFYMRTLNALATWRSTNVVKPNAVA